ncbi:hypothetical protein ACKWTF_014450 [Chironomus riparius]
MKIMGLSSALYWSSWFMRSFIILIISFTINLILTVTSINSDIPMFANSNPLIIWFFFISYITSMITFCFLVSVIFKKPSIANSVGSVTFLAAIAPYVIYHEDFYNYSYGLKMLFSMLINTNMGLGIKMIIVAENGYGGVGFGNVFTRPAEFEFSFGELMIWMNIGSALIMLLTIYIENAFPGKVGVAKSWHYPISGIIKLFIRDRDVRQSETSSKYVHFEKFDKEDEPENLKPGIEIKSLSKRFRQTYAVKKLSLNLYKDQITVLLGHNGAGKTTAMSMLTGLYQPTSGTAIINGYDIRTDLDKVRNSLGICPQYNVLFEELTVEEHLKFFCKLKGIKDVKDINHEVIKYSKMLGISDKLTSQSKTLSGGQKRRLSVAIALCGNSKFVILDEPTSGMDPTSRRQLWDLLIAEKKNRTILITTHFMDEADVLGDRIAIMSEGQLRTVGSSFFLKKTFGTGYRLTFVKMDDFESQAVLDVIQKYAPDAYVEHDGETEAVIAISEERLPIFDKIFKNIEDNVTKLKISSFGCSFTTLEDVFLKLSYAGPQEVTKRSDQSITIENPEKFQKIEGAAAIFNQIYAMFYKKFHIFRRNWKFFLVLILLSCLNIFILPYKHKNPPSQNALMISFNLYKDTESMDPSEHLFGPGDEEEQDILRHFDKLFTGKDRIVRISTDMEAEILKKYKNSQVKTNQENLIAATVKNDDIVAWYNTQPYHTMPLAVNTINRAILKSVTGSDYEISVTNKPYEVTNLQNKSSNDIGSALTNFIKSFMSVMLLMLIWPMFFIGTCIKEREIRFKFLQFICGTNRLIFWFTSLIFDYILFIIICSTFFGAMVLTFHEKVDQTEDFTALMVVGASYGFSWICFIYLFAYLFSKPSMGETMLQFVTIIFYVLAVLDTIFEAKLEKSKFRFLYIIVSKIATMFAPYNLVKMSKWMYLDPKPIDYTEINKYITINIASGLLYLLIVSLNDHNFFNLLYYKLHKSSIQNQRRSSTQSLDEDVRYENMLVNKMSMKNINASNLVIKNVTKNFNKTTAVNQLSLYVKQHECFGLLGVNGAGKTTTFKMMTGDELITSGDIWIKGKCLKTQLLEAHQFIGYCPQFDNCIPELTGRETLKIFALIRGIKMDEITEMINQMASELDFNQHLDKQVKAYSGGNKRKLSTALALLGNPELIFLDECTTGVDPQARRQIWNAIKRFRDNHRLSSSIVITSHSMDECEALCTRIGIMVAGQFQCLGPVQHLKNKFSKGSILTIKTGFTDENLTEKVKQRIVEKFRSAELKENYLDILTYHLKNIDLKYSEVFRKLAQIKNEMGIKDYALTQMSLEQVFLNISQEE